MWRNDAIGDERWTLLVTLTEETMGLPYSGDSRRLQEGDAGIEDSKVYAVAKGFLSSKAKEKAEERCG